MKTRTITLTICTVVALTGLTATAFAQDAAPPPASTAPAPVTRTGRTSGDIANGGLGVGGTMFVSGLAGPEVVYDFGAFHVSGMLAFDSFPAAANGDRGTLFEFGLAGWYHLHLGENSDFSLGGGLGMDRWSPPGPANGATGFVFEPGAQVRAFITPNVALHGGMALVFEFGDAVPNGVLEKHIALEAGLTGNFGFTYYFR